MLQASKVTIGEKTYDLNYVGKKKKTNLRRKLIVEYIQSKMAGELITIRDFMEVGQFTTVANTHSFIKRMVRDGVISSYNGEKPRTHYYGVTGAVRVSKPKTDSETIKTPDINSFIEDMKALGVKFTITISSEGVK